MKHLHLAITATLCVAALLFTGCHREKYAGEWKDQCTANLKYIDGAVQQWGLGHRKMDTDVPTFDDLKIYLKDGRLPECPAGGHYTIGSMGQKTKCSIDSHNSQ